MKTHGIQLVPAGTQNATTAVATLGATTSIAKIEPKHASTPARLTAQTVKLSTFMLPRQPLQANETFLFWMMSFALDPVLVTSHSAHEYHPPPLIEPQRPSCKPHFMLLPPVGMPQRETFAVMEAMPLSGSTSSSPGGQHRLSALVSA